jgi:transposase
MSLHPKSIEPVPEETARIARAAFPKGNVYLRLRDELGSPYTDETFADLFPTHGQPAEAPWRLAVITLLQFAEALSDRQAAEAVRARLDWKYLLGLPVEDAGFDASVLCEFRARLLAGGAAQRLLDVLLERFREHGLLKARGRQRTDSTHVLSAVRALNRLQGVGETMRHALNSLAVAAPDWLQPRLRPAWPERYGHQVDEYRLPKNDAARAALAATIGADGFELLEAIYAPEAPAWLRELPAVETLRRVWLQKYYAPDGGPIRWRSAADSPPAARLIHSPYDPEARFGCKRDVTWVGYKVHLTETCEPDAPQLVTHVETTPATTHDARVVEAIHADLARKELLPREHLVDTGYADAELLVSSQRQYGVDLFGPVLGDHSWQARAATGFDLSAFTVDWAAHTVTCPEGHTSTKWCPSRDAYGNEVIHIEFAAADCRACPSRPRCTRAVKEPREMGLRPQAQHEALRAARQRQTTAAFKAEYAHRAGVEGTLSQAIHVSGLRRARYIGLAKTRLQHVITAAALNVVRASAWLAGIPQAQTRQAPFVALALATCPA